jgi:hypothetical protein
MRLIMIIVACAACGIGVDPGGPGVAPQEQALSGTRLKVRFVQGDDGSKSVLGFRDTQRNEDCSFVEAEDGRQRCLPDFMFAKTGPRFFDPQCSIPIFASACVAASYGYIAAEACPFRPAIYSLEATVPSAIYGNALGSCDLIGSGSSAGIQFFRGTHVDPTAFAVGTITVEK